jgi:hypothetical protein
MKLIARLDEIAPAAAARDLERAAAGRRIVVRQIAGVAALSALAALAGAAWLAVPAAAAGAVLASAWAVLGVRVSRDADVMLYGQAFAPRPRDPAVADLLARRAAKLTSPCHLRGLASAVRADLRAGQRPRWAPKPPPAADVLARHPEAAERIAAILDRSRVDVRAVLELEWLLADARPSDERLARVERLLAA